MAQFEIDGTYGSAQTPCTVFVYEKRNGSKWYCVEGSCNVNLTYDDIEDGVDVEELTDVDMFTSSIEINTLNELEIAIES
jgi:hypothetical protein